MDTETAPSYGGSSSSGLSDAASPSKVRLTAEEKAQRRRQGAPTALEESRLRLCSNQNVLHAAGLPFLEQA